MSQENVETVRRSNAGFNRRDSDAAFADYHPDVEWRDLQHAPDSPESLRGISEVRTYWDQWMDSFEELEAEVEEYIDTGDAVLAVTHWRARGKGSGLVIDQRTVEVYEFVDGMIVRATMGHPDKEAGLRTIGAAD